MWAVPCEVPLAPIGWPAGAAAMRSGDNKTLQLLLFADRAGPFFLETFSCAISKPHHRLTPQEPSTHTSTHTTSPVNSFPGVGRCLDPSGKPEMTDAARASANVTLDSGLLARLAVRVGARHGLAVHQVIDLSNRHLSPRELESCISTEIADAQAKAASDVQACRFRPQSNAILTLRLRASTLGDAGLKSVAQALLLRAPLTLQTLCLAAVGAGDVGVDSLVAAIVATSGVQLVALDLSSNNLTARAGPALASLLAARKQRLEELRLSRNWLGDSGVASLADGFVTNQVLSLLHVDHNAVGPVGASTLAYALRSHSHLATLALGGNQLCDAAGWLAVKPLLGQVPSLRKLCLSDNALGAGPAGAFESHGGALDLALEIDPWAASSRSAVPSGNGLFRGAVPSAGGQQQPGAASYSLGALRCLTFERMHLRSDGAVAVAALLGSPTMALVELYLGGNSIGDKGATALARPLRTARSLRRLWLDRNEIGPSGAAAVLAAVLTLDCEDDFDGACHLERLNLDGNLLSAVEVAELHGKVVASGYRGAALQLMLQHPTS